MFRELGIQKFEAIELSMMAQAHRGSGYGTPRKSLFWRKGGCLLRPLGDRKGLVRRTAFVRAQTQVARQGGACSKRMQQDAAKTDKHMLRQSWQALHGAVSPQDLGECCALSSAVHQSRPKLVLYYPTFSRFDQSYPCSGVQVGEP